MEPLKTGRVRPPIEEIYRIAKQYSRRPEEVDDLVQELLLEAVRIGKDFSTLQFMAWGRGFLRNRAAFVARTEGRRRKREEGFHDHNPEADGTCGRLPERFIVRLSPSLSLFARLINCGLNRKEIRYLLDLADTALRQRLTALRREWRTYFHATGQHPEYPDEQQDGALPNGLIRQSLIQILRNSGNQNGNAACQLIGTHDPDGHLFRICSFPAHKMNSAGNKSIKKG